MTGTALTEEKEFRDIYGMDVIEIPTNRPVIRVDKQDAVYKTKKEKYHAVVSDTSIVIVPTSTGCPFACAMLKREGIQHTVLNAKFHELEAEIVSDTSIVIVTTSTGCPFACAAFTSSTTA